MQFEVVDDDIAALPVDAVANASNELGCRSLVPPAFGIGVGGFPLDECAQIVFAVFGREAYEAFSSAVSSPLPDGR